MKVPARERDQENELQKYKGASIPSKTFKFLQHLTQDQITLDETVQSAKNAHIYQTIPKSYSKPLEISKSTENFGSPSKTPSEHMQRSNIQKKVKFVETPNFVQSENEDENSQSQGSEPYHSSSECPIFLSFFQIMSLFVFCDDLTLVIQKKNFACKKNLLSAVEPIRCVYEWTF